MFPGQGVVLSLLAVAVLVGLVASYRRMTKPSVRSAVAIGFIAGGAIGNLIDRVRLGFVVDFVAIGPWPKFNVADSAITLGVVALAFDILFSTGARPMPRELVDSAPTAGTFRPPPITDG